MQLFRIVVIGEKSTRVEETYYFTHKLLRQLYLRAHYQVLAAFPTVQNLVVMAIVLLSSQTLV